MNRIDPEHYRGCLLGGAIGDALGYPVEFDTEEEIFRRFGNGGIRELQTGPEGVALVSDDTQMMLFTGEGLLNAMKDSVNPAHAIWESYLRWYSTQGYPLDESLRRGDLVMRKELNARRGPGLTNLSALATGKMGNRNTPLNHSKGNGTVMRVAPVGLFYPMDSRKAFRLGLESGLTTHGHPTGGLAAGFLAALISEILRGNDLSEGIAKSLEILADYTDQEETRNAVEKALRLNQFNVEPREAIRIIGPGKVAEEALAIGLYCSLRHSSDFREGLILAVNHGGDSDSTGIIAGYILGAMLGTEGIPLEWLTKVELGSLISRQADELLSFAET